MTAVTGTPQATGSKDAEYWNYAKQIAGKLCYVPSSFSTAVRALVADHNQFNKKVRPVTKYQVARLLQGQTFKSLIYYASKTLHDDKLPKTKPWTVGQLMDLYEPFDLSVLIGCFLFTRKCRKFMTPDKWTKIEELMREDSQIGAHLGVAIPAIGMGMGLLINTVRWYGLAALLIKDEKPWVNYKIHLKKSDLKWDLAWERQNWGCSSKEIAVFILSSLGLGVEITDAFATAIEPTTTIDRVKIPAQLRARLALLWVDALKAGKSQPTDVLPGEYYPLQKTRERLNVKVQSAMAGDKHFLARTKDEISQALSPELFGELKVGADVPEELATIFSVDEITKMEENDFDNLIDQIDNEQAGKVVAGSISAKDVKELEDLVAD